MSLFTFGRVFGTTLTNNNNNNSSSDIIDITNNANNLNTDVNMSGNAVEIVDSEQEDEEDDRENDDDSYMEFRAKIPRLNSNSNVKEAAKSENNNENSEVNDEEVSKLNICFNKKRF